MITEGIIMALITTVGGIFIAFLRRQTAMKAQIQSLEQIGDTLEKMGADKFEVLNRMAGILADVSQDVEKMGESVIEMRTQINNIMNIQVGTSAASKRTKRKKRK